MNTISAYLGADHKRCDALFAQLEADVDQGQWEPAQCALLCFSLALKRHFAMEENVMFAAFERATGSADGPAGVMRVEHRHIRAIVSRMCEAAEKRDANDFFSHADTLHIMMEQHNLKEESILYLMADRILCGSRDEIMDAMNAIKEFNAPGVIDAIE